MDIRYSLDENGNKYLPVTHKKAVKGVNLNILDNFSDDKGYIQAIDDADLETMEQFLKSGFYYAKDVINSPDPTDSNGYVIIIARSTTYKQAIFIPFNKNRMYLKHQVGNDIGWTDWTLIESNNSDTSSLFDTDGFIPLIENLDLKTMDEVDRTGFYYINSPINSPDGTNDNGYLLVFARGNIYKKAMFMPYNKNRIYTINQLSEDWGEWYQIGNDDLEKKVAELEDRISKLEDMLYSTDTSTLDIDSSDTIDDSDTTTN